MFSKIDNTAIHKSCKVVVKSFNERKQRQIFIIKSEKRLAIKLGLKSSMM